MDGPLSWDDAVFRVAAPTPAEVDWSSIHRIVAYKIDRLTWDEIRVRLEHAEGEVVVTEESPKFTEFMEEIVRRFHSAASWHADVSQPAFELCETVLYERRSDNEHP